MRLPSGGSSAIAIVLTGALLAATAGGGGLLDGRIAFDLQARAAAVLYPLSRYSIAISLPAGGLAYVIAIYLIRAIDPEEWRLARDGLLARLRPGRAA
jgi:hypothetical protein